VTEEERNWRHVPTHTLMDRHDLVRNAVAFLSDPSVGHTVRFLTSAVSHVPCPVAGLVSRTEDPVS
jgi:hypothetical protein